MDRLPTFLDKRIFGLIFEIGEIGKLTEEELMSYEASLKHKRDILDFNSIMMYLASNVMTKVGGGTWTAQRDDLSEGDI